MTGLHGVINIRPVSIRQMDRGLRYDISALGLLIDQGPIAVLVVLVNAGVYVYFSRDFVATRHLQFWVGAVSLIAAGRICWQLRWNRDRPQTAEEIHRANYGLYLLGTMSAACWGLGSAMLFNEASYEHFAVSVLILGGMAAGAAGAYSANLRLAVLFLAFLVLPFAVRLINETRLVYNSIGLISLFYLGLLIMVAYNGNRHVRRSIEVGLDNEDLVHRLGAASHEIRTPVSAISGFAEMLAAVEDLKPAAHQYSELISRNCSYLKRLVDNILVMSRTELGVEDKDWESVRVREQVALALDMIRQPVEEKNLFLNLNFADNVPERARLQTVKLQQILINLLANAVKFTLKGGITVDVLLSREAELIIRVTDTGIGIKEANISYLFEPYWREKQLAVSTEGSGLGLSLSRSLARSMGGDLRLLTADCEKGCVFELRVPLVV